jgi:hypothetical protein
MVSAMALRTMARRQRAVDFSGGAGARDYCAAFKPNIAGVELGSDCIDLMPR